jgi:benzoate-CoA ligase family protein
MEPFNAAADLLDAHDPARVAVVTRESSITYGELRALVEAVGGGLRALGLGAEQRVAMVLLDSVEFYAVFLGAMHIGAVPVPVNPLLPARDVNAIVAQSRAALVVASPGRVPAVEGVRVIEIGTPEWAELASSAPAPVADTWNESPGFWLCTSGSTGTPKLAMHRHADLRVTADTYGRSILGTTPDDRCYSVGPMFHAYGLGNSLTFPFAVGASAVVEPTRPPTPALVASIAASLRPTLFFCIPTFYAALLASDVPDDSFASVRSAVSAAEPLPADVYTRFRDRFGVEILDGIGSTEMAHIFISNRPGDVVPGSSGRPVPGYHVALLDDAGADVAPGVAGHLWVGGESMATGYWCNSTATRASFHGPRMRTGDMYERSEGGHFTYLGRSDDMLKVGGEWVSPAEVEALLISHPDVLEAAVVAERDQAGRQVPVAFVVPAPPLADVDVAALEALCKGELAGYKRPRRYVVLPELPKTATGKIQRYKLRAVS